MEGDTPDYTRKRMNVIANDIQRVQSDISKMEHIQDLNTEFIAGVKGAFGFIKIATGVVSAIMVMLIGVAITLNQQNMSLVNDNTIRITKTEARIEYLVTHQIPELLSFKQEVEEQGSPILRATVKEVAEMKKQLEEGRAEVRALSSVFVEAQRHRDRPDIQDAKQ